MIVLGAVIGVLTVMIVSMVVEEMITKIII